MEVLETARRKKIPTLSEYDSKRVLAEYGIPVTREKLVKNGKDAVAAAEAIGYPVVLKATGPTLTHKTELDAIRLNLKDAKEVRKAVKDLKDGLKGQKLQGLLVQEMVKGQRELVMGLTRDPQFGPCVMFGLGGIYTEILKDVSFRVAPLTRQDALDMISEIRGYRLLAGARGEKPADVPAITEAILRLAQLAMDFPEMKELDINPLLAADPGQGAVAVDCRIVIG